MVEKEKQSSFGKKTLKVIGVYLSIIALFSLGPIISDAAKKKVYDVTNKSVVAYIQINGSISSKYSEETIQLIEKARKDKVDAYVFEINSGGGEVLPSKDISDKINEVERGFDNKKGTNDDIKTIALIKGVGASGAYWIASAADLIIADETSFVGSIGVRGGFFDFSGLMKKLGIGYHEIKSGDSKTIGSPYRQPTYEELKQLEDLIVDIHHKFIKHVANNRNLSYEKIKALADGRVYPGDEAKEKGLIDEVGGVDILRTELRKYFGKEDSDIVFVKYERAKSPFNFLNFSR